MTRCCLRCPAKDVQPERTAVLVIRAWADKREPRQLRARITQVADVSARTEVESVATSEEEIVQTVRSWVRNIVRAG